MNSVNYYEFRENKSETKSIIFGQQIFKLQT